MDVTTLTQMSKPFQAEKPRPGDAAPARREKNRIKRVLSAPRTYECTSERRPEAKRRLDVIAAANADVNQHLPRSKRLPVNPTKIRKQLAKQARKAVEEAYEDSSGQHPGV
jgi:hypothetical protein